jgi:hypothetical protein
MRDDAEVLLKHEPTTYALYNEIVDMREWRNLRPEGAGNYIPAIKAAEKLLTTNANAGCAISLLFFSDGSPSDKHNGDFTSSIGHLAAEFGRRLSLACIGAFKKDHILMSYLNLQDNRSYNYSHCFLGMADRKEDFSVLSDMVDEAKSYGSIATFGKPSLDSESLSCLVSSLASSVTSTKTEMTEAKSGKSKPVQNVTREKINTPDKEGAWHFYEKDASSRVVSVSTWQYKKNEYIKLIDPRCSICYDHVGYSVSLTQGIVCGRCNSYCICYNCHSIYGASIMTMHRTKQAGKRSSECSKNLLKTANGDLIMRRLPSFFIVFKEKIFSEGAERMVRKVRFVDAHGNFTGQRYVAKESRFIGKCIK